jgi:hypothetical protein
MDNWVNPEKAKAAKDRMDKLRASENSDGQT